MCPWPGCVSRHHQNSRVRPGGEEADANTQAAWAEASWSKSKARFEENPGLQRDWVFRHLIDRGIGRRGTSEKGHLMLIFIFKHLNTNKI